MLIFLFTVFESFLFPPSFFLESRFNPANLVEKRVSATFNIENMFSIPGLNKYNLFLQLNNFGFTVVSFGNEFYRENLLGLGLGFEAIKGFHLGLDISLLNYWIENGNSEYSYTLKVGSSYGKGSFKSSLWFTNLNFPKFSEIDCLPLGYELFTYYQGNEQLSFYFSVRGLEINFPFFNFGLDFHPYQIVKFILGVNTEPLKPEYGMAIQLGRLELSYSGSNHRQLGLTHLFNLSFRIR